jgi:hypothetical protein
MANARKTTAEPTHRIERVTSVRILIRLDPARFSTKYAKASVAASRTMAFKYPALEDPKRRAQ